MKTQCPHCNQKYDVSDDFNGQVVECSHCKQEFFVETYQEELDPVLIATKQKREKNYKVILVEGISELEKRLNILGWEGWRPVAMSTIFLGENSVGFGGFEGATRHEGLAVILERRELS